MLPRTLFPWFVLVGASWVLSSTSCSQPEVSGDENPMGEGSGGATHGSGGAAGGAGGTSPHVGGRTGSGGSVASSGGRASGGAAGSIEGETGGRNALGGAEASVGGSTGGSATLDVFGITQLYPSDASHSEWTSAHYDEDYEVSFGTDSRDPSGLSGARGEGTLQVTADGELTMSGSQPRLYVNPDADHPWQNLEITVYYQRIEDEGEAYAGLVVGARSGPDGHTTDGACDSHTYYSRLRNDGAFDFEKELKHPASSTQARVQPEKAWPPNGEVPREAWIGWKFVLYDLGEERVKLEAYRDLSEGVNGGDWELVNETIDEGGWFVETDCAEHAPEDGESDLVVQGIGSILIRNTEVTEARYRSISVREIIAPG